jgi:tryptophanyl-tRNA synthetase
MESFLTGLQPSGNLHIGNYFGCIKDNIEYSKKAKSSIIFIADLHALTTVQDKLLLQKYIKEQAITLLACGLDPKKTILFKQSDVLAHSELTWILSTITPLSFIERCHSFKDKKSKGFQTNVGLLTYPILMVSDIVLYSPDTVPVGKDQKQHLEISRDIVNKFNNIYGGSVLKLPEPLISEKYGVIPGIDGEKMSKSYNNTIPIFAEKSIIKKSVMKIKTDSKSIDEVKDYKNCTIFKLSSLFLDDKDLNLLKQKYETKGIGYGELKNNLYNTIINYFSKFKSKYDYYNDNYDLVENILSEGSIKANNIANNQLNKIKKRIGLL